MKTHSLMSRLSLLTILFFSCSAVHAQEIKAILVQLSSEQNRINYFKNGGHPLDAVEIALEAKKVRRATIFDFTDNFDYCPVYYYIDTNREAIRNKHFTGFLLDGTGAPVNNPVINSADSDYIVVYYGYSDATKTVAPDHKSLVILNDKFQQIYVVFKSEISSSVSDPGPNAKYMYMSKKYDIDYSPHAEKLKEHMDKVIKKLDRSRD